jgi:hypothetical protein
VGKYVSKKEKSRFPLLEGESMPPARSSKDVVQAEAKARRTNPRDLIERARLEAIANRLKKPADEIPGNLKRTPVSERKVPSLQKSGLSSSILQKFYKLMN